MKTLFLFNRVMGPNFKDFNNGVGHDTWFFGMNRLSKHGIDAGFLEIENYIPKKVCNVLRKYILTMHYAHIPLFPLFFKYDAIFTSTAYGSLFIKAIFRIKRFKWVLLDFNVLGTIEERKTIKQKIFYYSIKHGVDGIVAISEAEANALKKVFPNIADNIIYIKEATDTKYFKPLNTEEKNQIISVGQFGRDFDTVIKAVSGMDVNLLIVGKFPKEKIGTLPSNVKVVQLSHTEILQAYAESKISVISLKISDRYYDSIGTLTVGESMSMGKASIVTYSKNMESYVNDGVNAIFVKPNNVDHMREKITYLLNNDTERRRIGDKAREYAIENLDLESWSNQLAIYLKNMV